MKTLSALFLTFFLLIFSIQSPLPAFARSKSQEGKPIPFALKQQESITKISKNDLRQSVEELLFEGSNQTRENKNLNRLAFHPLLQKAARFHSEDMLKRDYFSHFSPEGKSVLERIQKFQLSYDETCGENLHTILSAKGLSDPRAISNQMVKDWLGSPDHRKNLLSKDYALLGVGCATDGFKIFCTQVFSGAHL